MKLLLKTTVYYIIWQKFRKQIILILCSIILILLIGVIYEDLFKVLKVTNKNSIGLLLFMKWFLISLIIGFNIYVIRKTKIDSKDISSCKAKETVFTNYSQKEKDILKKKEKLISTTDLLFKKYEK